MALQELRFWARHPEVFETKTGGWKLGLAYGGLVGGMDPEVAATRVLQEFEELSLTRRVASDAELVLPGLRVAHPFAGCTVRLLVNLTTDSFGKRRCKYPTHVPLVRFPVPAPVHLHVSQSSTDKGSLCIDKAFAQRISPHGLGKWDPGKHNLSHVALMAWDVLMGSEHAADSISGVALSPDKVPVLVRLMSATSEHLREEWRRRRGFVLWRRAKEESAPVTITL